MPTYYMFLDFPNGHTVQVETYNTLAIAIQCADYQRESSGNAVHVSIHRGGKCYYSTDITVTIDGMGE